jgi:hypothetical protein
MDEMSLAALRNLLLRAGGGMPAGMDDPYRVPTPYPVAPGMAPVQVLPPGSRDRMDRPAVSQGYDRNAVQGDDLMKQYFYRRPGQENI